MNACFGMYGKNVCARFCKIVNIAIRILYHQMHVKDSFADGPDGFYNRKAHGNAWHKHSIHYVNMDVFCSRAVQKGNLSAQIRKIR